MRGVVSGRGPELARLSELLSCVAESTARAAVVEGPAGIGKSTVLQFAAEDAAARGFAVLSARSEEMERERTFGAIASLVSTTEVGSRGDMANLLSSAPADGSSFRVVDELVNVVETEALQRPVLVSLDDAQWADEWSVRAIGILFRRLERLPVGLVVGARPSPRSADLTALISSLVDRGIHVPLAPLDSDAVAEIVRSATGAEPTPRLRRTLERAGGNPFFVRELYEALDRDQMLVPAGETVDVAASATPPGLLVTLLHRMKSLSAGALELVRTAAVLSGSFSVRELAVASGQPTESLLEPLLHLRDEGILAEEDEQFRFRHDLLREAVYEDLGGPVRAAMHAHIGHAFDAAGFGVADVAHHLLRGAQRGDVEAAERMIEAAESGQITLTQSASLLRRALELVPDHPRGLELKRALARLLHTTDRPREAIPLLEEVLAALDDPARQLEVVSALAVAALRAGEEEARRAWRERAAELAAGLSGSADPRVLLNIAQCHFDRSDFAAAAAVSARAISLARAAGDSATEEEAENRCAWLLTGLGRVEEALKHSGRALAMAAGRPTEPMRLIHQAGARRAAWELDIATRELARARRVSGELGAVAMQLRATCDSALLDCAAARWEEALLHADTAWEMMRELGITSDAAHPAFVHAWVALRTGEMPDAERFAAMADPNRVHSNWIKLLIAIEKDDERGAMSASEGILEYRKGWPYAPQVETAVVDVVRAAVRFDQPYLAKEAAALAFEFADPTQASSRQLAALRCRAIVEGDHEAARRAVELARACPWPVVKGNTFEDAAGVLEESRDDLLALAAETYDAAGVLFDLSRVSRGLKSGRQAKARQARPATGWEALTEAESRVVELAAEGLTNREIGERLFISHRTAGTHLAHAFDKLQVRSRVELARLAAARASSNV